MAELPKPPCLASQRLARLGDERERLLWREPSHPAELTHRDAACGSLRIPSMRAIALVLLLATTVPAAGGGAAKAPRSSLLVALPALGSVTWRCGRMYGAYGLGYREFWSSATTSVSVRADGRLLARRTVNPHQLVSFPLTQAPVQQLTFVQSTEPGTLRAVVTVRFREHAPGYPPCEPSATAFLGLGLPPA